MDLELKEKNLRNYIKNIGSCLVALSGGIDSSYLALITYQELGENMKAITAVSPSFPKEMKKIVEKFTKKFNIPHIFIKTEEINNPLYLENNGLRCYACKKELFTKMREIAKKENFKNIIEGTQGSDLNDQRPGMKAAKEMDVINPLILYNFEKDQIRERAKILGIEHYDLPESACLGSRIVQGEKITEEKLRQVEMAEKYLKSIGFKKVRVRYHNFLARIELEKDKIDDFFDSNLREKVVKYFKKLGFEFITLDLEGYKRGGGNFRISIKNK